MIAPIPGQPLAFNDTRFQGCVCLGPGRCLPVFPDDIMRVQFDGVLCATSDELLDDTSTTNKDFWNKGGWDQQPLGPIKQTCIVSDGILGPAPLVEMAFNATVGTYYTVQFTIQSISGEIHAFFAGVDLGGFTSIGTYVFTVQAFNTSSWQFSVFDVASACISYASVKETNTDLQVFIINQATGLGVGGFTFDSKPEWFTFIKDHFNIEIPIGENGPGNAGLVDGCYFLRVVDVCDSVTLESECFNVGQHDCTILLTACNNNDSGGIYFDNLQLQMRVRGKVCRTTYKYDERIERLSNGDLNRYYADRMTGLELRIDGLNEFHNDFISLLPILDHVYIGQEEYVFDASGYAPDYNDFWDDQAPVTIAIRPKKELYRKVRCADDNGGCAPPPNYWVEGTGPNSQYILNETDNSRIPLNA